jgi:hypothetical protein
MLNLFISTLLLVAFASPAAALLSDEEPSNNSIANASIQLPIPPDENVVSVDAGLLTFTVGGGDLDYLGIGGLLAGDVVNVSTTPLGDPPAFEIPDTIVGLFSDNGSTECVGDDAFNNDLDQFPTGFGSLCRFEIPTDGDYFIGVTGFSAVPFDGAHFEEGKYSLTVNVTRLPEPGVLLQLASGALALAALHKRRRTEG